MGETIDSNIEKEMQSSYIDYAMSVIVGRALPDARDGLKPAQRRILYSMYKINNTHDQPTKKSARIVGECFVRDTLVLTNEGLIPIQNVKKGDKVYTQEGLHKVSELYIMPKRKLIRVKLESGIDNVVTNSQQFKVITKDWEFLWKEAKDLEFGDYVLMKSTYPEIEEEINIGTKKLNENVAYLLGQLLSDGFVINDNERNKYHRIGFCSTSMGIINNILSCLQKEFSYTPTVEEKTSEYLSTSGQVVLSKIYQIRVSNGEISKFFITTFNLLGCKALSKRLPEQIFKSPKRVIFAFLSGLFDGDGHIHAKRNAIEYSTISEEMANQLMILLQHLEIYGKKYKTEHKPEGYILGRKVHLHNSFSLEFDGINAQKLAHHLDLKEERKKKRAEELTKRQLKQSKYDILPWASSIIFEELSKRHLGGGWYIDNKGNKFRAGIKYQTGTKIRYSSNLNNLPLTMNQIIEWGIQKKLGKINSPLAEFINSILRDNIHFSSVISVDDAGEDVTYDIQVEEKHELIANGMVAHNCIGKYHPHGDMAVYETLIRMAQDFSMNHTLVEGQGNMGSVDGDPPAAQRYTEVRLSRLAEEMLEDLEKKSVTFVPNFDNVEEEPLLLPSKVPNLLINGASGIAVGVATNIMPHNLSEICDAVTAYIKNQEITSQELLEYVQGPDLPTGGSIFYNNALISSYLTGRGSVIIRGKATTEKLKNKTAIIITEIPYNVNKATMVETIANLVKAKKIVGISDLRDESGKEGIRVVIELRQDADPDMILGLLYNHTQLEISLPVMNIAVIGNNLVTLNLRQFVKTFVDHRIDVIRKRTQYDLSIALDRLHIVEGLLIAVNDIDNVIVEIKKSADIKEARATLVGRYSITEKQANAILDMKLSKLTSLETGSLQSERKELTTNISNLNEILESDGKIYGIIEQETKYLKGKYGRPRRTMIDKNVSEKDFNREDFITDDDATVILTNNNYIKRIATKAYRSQDRGGKGVITIQLKEGDFVKQITSCKLKDYLLIISNKGRAYWLKAYIVPEESKYGVGKAAINLIKLAEKEKVEAIINTRNFENTYLTFITTKGRIKRIRAEKFSRPRSNGINAIPILEGDSLADVCISDGQSELMIATKLGKALRFKETDIRPMGRGAQGVRGIRLNASDSVVNIISAKDKDLVASVTEKGFGKVTELSKYRLQKRGGKGVINIKSKEKTGHVVRALKVSNIDNVIMINSKGISITFPVEDIRVTGRAASGVRLMRLDSNAVIVDAQAISKYLEPAAPQS